MKKKLIILCAVLLLLLVIPIPTGAYKDGGTREYTALTYKIVDWNHMTADGVYDKTKVYPFPMNFLSLDSLLRREEKNFEKVAMPEGETDAFTGEQYPVAAGEPVTDAMTDETKYTTAEIMRGAASISLRIPEGWKYEQIESEDGLSFGIDFWPAGHDDGRISLFYYTDLFGVCGTGLSTEEITLGNYDAVVGRYDGDESWSFIRFTNAHCGEYVATAFGASSWLPEYEDEVNEILASAVLNEYCR